MSKPLHERIDPVYRAWPQWVPRRSIDGQECELTPTPTGEWAWSKPTTIWEVLPEPDAAAHWFRAMVVGLAASDEMLGLTVEKSAAGTIFYVEDGDTMLVTVGFTDPIDALIDASLWLARKEGKGK